MGVGGAPVWWLACVHTTPRQQAHGHELTWRRRAHPRPAPRQQAHGYWTGVARARDENPHGAVPPPGLAHMGVGGAPVSWLACVHTTPRQQAHGHELTWRRRAHPRPAPRQQAHGYWTGVARARDENPHGAVPPPGLAHMGVGGAPVWWLACVHTTPRQQAHGHELTWRRRAHPRPAPRQQAHGYWTGVARARDENPHGAVPPPGLAHMGVGGAPVWWLACVHTTPRQQAHGH